MGRILTALARFNRNHPWSHNDAYARVVLHAARRVRAGGGTSALDIGCGTGRLVVRLARVLPEVTGLEAHEATAARAEAAVAALPNARIVHAAFPGGADSRYDLVSLMAVLHHLPLVEGLRAAREAVAPGGRLVVVGLYGETSRDLWLSLLSLALNPVVGAVLHPRRAERTPEQMTAPTADVSEDFDQIRSAMRAELPGVSVRRGLFWRYVATWTAPPR